MIRGDVQTASVDHEELGKTFPPQSRNNGTSSLGGSFAQRSVAELPDIPGSIPTHRKRHHTSEILAVGQSLVLEELLL